MRSYGVKGQPVSTGQRGGMLPAAKKEEEDEEGEKKQKKTLTGVRRRI